MRPAVPLALVLLVVVPTLSGCFLLTPNSTITTGRLGPYRPVETCDADAPVEPGEIPPCIRRNADAFLAHRLGKERAATWLTLEENASAAGEAYTLVYRLRVPDEPSAETQVPLVIARDGSPVDAEAAALPPCRIHPGECAIDVDADEAERRAREAGLAEGPTRAAFGWTRGHEGTFAWFVRSLREGSFEGGSGDEVVLDANTGEVLRHLPWSTAT